MQGYDIPHTSSEIAIDADLTDKAWEQALTIDLNLVNSPFDNTPSPIKTTAKIIENGDYLYISFEAFDPAPEKIQAAIGNRDSKWHDDLVGIKIDTLNKKRTSYNFYVNAVGVQNDEIYDEINQESNELWDGIWFSRGKITSTGYVVEIAIPFNILNFEQSDNAKSWPFELLRQYPRGSTSLRISHVPLDRDNNCWLCQYPSAHGFDSANIDKNITLTPSIVAANDQKRDIYESDSDWQSDENIEPSLDLRWGITPSTVLNATLNPDFSTVETDAGQLDINETFSLFYDEKRPFFNENSSYFSSPQNLVYTRNIVDPDYGLKVTGSNEKHNYGVFVSHDNFTNFIVSGNLGASIATLDEQSHSGALRYQYDANEELTIGAISTLRKADGYHNYVAGIDASYRLSYSDLFIAQWLTSDTLYPNDLNKQFCNPDCLNNEQALRANKDESFSDKAYSLAYAHKGEYWHYNASHEYFGKDFRADLGFITRTDYIKDDLSIARLFYSDDEDSRWQEMSLEAKWNILHNVDGELIGKALEAEFYIDGPWLSAYEIKYTHADKVGIRADGSSLAIDGNTTRFNENQLALYAKIRPTNKTFFSIDATIGDKIDYANNRLGDYYSVKGNMTWNVTHHIELDLYHTMSELSTNSERVLFGKFD